MRILFNDKLIQCDENITVLTLLEQLKQLKPGIALALNRQVLPREKWQLCQICEGDQILLFQVITGG